MRRHKLSRGSSQASFKRGAGRLHRKNLMSSTGASYAMRGGIRL